MASNIQVVLELDNKKYLGNLKAADSATKNFTRNAKELDKTSGIFNNLAAAVGRFSAIASAALGAATVMSIRYADSIQDLADATDMATSTVLGFTDAVMKNGGSVEGAQNSILRFNETLAEAIQGNNNAQKAFAAVGISLRDLQTLGNEELFKKAVQGLGRMTDASARLKAQTDLLGKGAKGVSFPGVAGQIGPSIAESIKLAAATKSAADAQQSLENNLKNLQSAILLVVQPLNDIAKGINISVSAFESLIKAVMAAVGVYLIFGKALPVVKTVMDGLDRNVKAQGGAFKWLGTQIMGIIGGIKSFIVGIGRATGLITGGTSAAFSFAAALAGLARAFLRFTGIVGIVYAVAEAINFLSKQFFDFDIIDWVVGKFKVLYDIAKKFFGLGQDDDNNEIQRMKNRAATLEEETKRRNAASAAAAEFAKRQAEMADEIANVSRELERANYHRKLDLELETFLIGKTEDQIELYRGLDNISNQLGESIQGLLDKRRQWAKGTEEQRASLYLIDAEIEKIKALEATYQAEFTTRINALQSARLLEKDRLATIERITQAIEQQRRIEESLASARLTMIGGQQDVAFQATLIGKGDLQRQMMEIAETNRKAALEASRAFAQAFEDEGDGLTPERAKQLADGLEAIRQGYANIAQAQTENLNKSREWSAGWEEAFANYKDNAENAADQAKTYFETFTRGFEDALVRFVQTGKLSFKDLANSIIADIVRIQAKRLILAAFGGGNPITSFFGSLFGGKAGGGNVEGNTPYVVGERGPELFVPNNAGKIISNKDLQTSTQPTVINNAVSYQIQAVDASSFRSLVARDPEFIFNVTEQGRRSLPTRSRR